MLTINGETQEKVMLRKLLTHFSQYYWEPGLKWQYIEGTPIRDIESIEFENDLIAFMRENGLGHQVGDK